MDARIFVSTLIFGSFLSALLISAQIARFAQPSALDVIILATIWGVFTAALVASIAMMLGRYESAARALRFATWGHLVFLLSFVVLPTSIGFYWLLFVYALSSTPLCAMTAWKVQRAVRIRPSIEA